VPSAKVLAEWVAEAVLLQPVLIIARIVLAEDFLRY